MKFTIFPLTQIANGERPLVKERFDLRLTLPYANGKKEALNCQLNINLFLSYLKIVGLNLSIYNKSTRKILFKLIMQEFKFIAQQFKFAKDGQ